MAKNNNKGITPGPYKPDEETVKTSQGAKATYPKTIEYKGDTGISPLFDSSLYFKGNNFICKVLRFFNLLEPGRTVISISKLFMWIVLGTTVYVVIYQPNNIPALIGAAGGMIGTLMNYGWRRYVQYRNELAHLNIKEVERSGDDYKGPPDKKTEIEIGKE